VQALSDEYSRIGWKQALEYKLRNIETVLGHPAVYVSDWFQVITEPAQAKQTAARLRHQAFFELVAALGPLTFAPLLLLYWRRRNRAEYRAAASLWLCVVITTLWWCGMMFGPGTTSIHTGTYAWVLMAYAGSVLAIWAVSPVVAGVVTFCSAISQFFIFEVLNEPDGKNIVSTLAMVAAAMLVSSCWVLWRLSKPAPVAAAVIDPRSKSYSRTAKTKKQRMGRRRSRT
jgi:hypothetical protein